LAEEADYTFLDVMIKENYEKELELYRVARERTIRTYDLGGMYA